MCVSSESAVSGVFNVSVFLSLTLSGQNGSSARLSFFKLTLHRRSDSNERYSASSQRRRTAQISLDSWIPNRQRVPGPLEEFRRGQTQ